MATSESKSDTASAFIEAVGTLAFANAVGVGDGLVRVWKTRKYIPRAHWPEVMQAYPGLTHDVLKRWEAHRAPAPKGVAA